MLLQKNGGVLPRLAVGLTDNFTIGMSYGFEKLIGNEKPTVSRPKPEVQFKYRLFEETIGSPAVLLGLDTQGRGSYHSLNTILINGKDSIHTLNRYDQKSWGIYMVTHGVFKVLMRFQCFHDVLCIAFPVSGYMDDAICF